MSASQGPVLILYSPSSERKWIEGPPDGLWAWCIPDKLDDDMKFLVLFLYESLQLRTKKIRLINDGMNLVRIW